MKIYLDNCCFNRPFDDQRQINIRLETEAKLFVQQKIISGEFELAWSYILDYENECNPFEERRNIIRSWRFLAKYDIEETPEILEEAQKLHEIGLKSKDALHVSCAVIHKCDFMLTTDKEIIKKMENYKKIRILNVVMFVNEYGD